MSNEAFGVYLALGIGLPILVGLWARAWNRGNPIVWGLIAFFLTPFGVWIVALTLLLRGPNRTAQRGPGG